MLQVPHAESPLLTLASRTAMGRRESTLLCHVRHEIGGRLDIVFRFRHFPRHRQSPQSDPHSY